MANNKIIVFACNWSHNITKDIEQIEETNIIRVMCSGRITTALILKAFELGTDGVLVLGCPDGECHYNFGNKQAKKQFEITKNLANVLGIEPEKIQFESIPKDEEMFTECIKKFANNIKKNG